MFLQIIDAAQISIQVIKSMAYVVFWLVGWGVINSAGSVHIKQCS